MGQVLAVQSELVDMNEERIIIEDDNSIRINSEGLFYKDLNMLMREIMLGRQLKKITIYNVYGQRYIGTNLRQPVKVEIFGTPGNDLGAFMDGPIIEIFGNAQDGCGNTMNNGEIIIHGNAGDITGFSARGGEIYVKGNVGYRVGIHMKEYKDKKPTMIIGGTAQDFLGEYMAGGRMIILGLGLPEGDAHKANFIGTGMHGGVIYVRGKVEKNQLGKEVSPVELDDNDKILVEKYVKKFSNYFGYNAEEIMSSKFTKLLPLSLRPYGRLYAY